MDNKIKQRLIDWAGRYESPAFIIDDPVQFPRKHIGRWAEIVGFLTSWVSFGNRKSILEAAQRLEDYGLYNSYYWVMTRRFEIYRNDCKKFYRFLSYDDLYRIGERLWGLYYDFHSMEDMILSQPNKTPVEALCDYFKGINGIPDYSKGSACKRLCMFLRWMVRADSPVDMGLWHKLKADDLIIPLDTHVHRMALELGLTSRKRADMQTALEITGAMKEVFPNDPAKGDFALFGYGVEHK